MMLSSRLIELALIQSLWCVTSHAVHALHEAVLEAKTTVGWDNFAGWLSSKRGTGTKGISISLLKIGKEFSTIGDMSTASDFFFTIKPDILVCFE